MTAEEEQAVDSVLELVRRRTGLVFSGGRRAGAVASVRRVTAAREGTTAKVDVHRFEADDEVFDSLLAQLTVGETYFFREPAQFDALRHTILPELRRCREPAAFLRFWSAGCASGEEPYSLAILLDQEGLADRATILATDLSPAALSLARAAEYGIWSLRGNAAAFSTRYFHRHGEHFHLQERYRRAVAFERINLAAAGYPAHLVGAGAMDVILCRNVLIYFDAGTIDRVARHLYDSLAPDGWLVAGPSDPPLWDKAPFQVLRSPAGILYRRGRSEAMPAPRDMAPKPREAAPARPHRVARPGTAPRPYAGPPPPPDVGVEAREAFAAGDLVRVVWLTRSGAPDVQTCVLRVRALAGLGRRDDAEACAAEALGLHRLSAELHYLRGVILMDLERYTEAVKPLRRALYLDRSLTVAHFVLGSLLLRQGRTAEARRAYRTVLAQCAERNGEATIPYADGERAGNMAEAARAQLAGIDAKLEVTP